MDPLQFGESLSLVLLDAAAKGTVLLAATCLATLALRRSSAAMRHRVWGLTMGGLVLLPALSWLLPAWRLPILPAHAEQGTSPVVEIGTEPIRQLSTRDRGEESPDDELAFARPVATADPGSTLPVDSRYALSPPNTSQPSTPATPMAAEPQSAAWVFSYVAFVWSLGTSLFLAGVAFGIRRTGRLWHASQTITDESWSGLARDLCARLGLRRPVHLREHAEPVVPLTWGLLRPIILLPQQARCWSDSMRRAVLLHELAHVHRGDVAYQLLARFACALYWFHPLAWFGLHQLRQEREHACDDAVVGSGERASDYAEQLLEVARRYRRAGGLALAVEITRGGSLEQRVRALFDAARSHAPVGRRLAVSLLAVTSLFVSAIAILHPVAAEPQAVVAKVEAGADASPAATAVEHSEEVTAGEIQDRQKAAELVRALYASEAWIDSVHSILIRTQLEQTRGERPNDYSRTILWAWDNRRIRHETQIRETKDSPVSGWRTTIWDGSLAADSSKNEPGDNDNYVLGSTSGPYFEQRALHTFCNEWEIARHHRFWWLPVDVDQWNDRQGLVPEDFELAGEEELNGRPCQVVQSRTGHLRFHIGAADGRLYRRTWLVVRPEFPEYDRLALYRKVGGEAIKTVYHWQPWLESLEPQPQRRARRALAASEFELSRPHVRETLDDYREVAPGCWFPFSRVRDFYEFSRLPKIDEIVSVVQSRLDETTTEMSVNQALPDELFQIELTDGVKTQDQRYDPIINYNYRKGQTENERLALREAERERRGREDAGDHRVQDEFKARNVLKSRVGSAPPPLPKDGWIIGGPLNWEALRGKVVMLHFFDLERERYQQVCENELPVMQRWHANSDKSGVVVIGVHRPTNDAAAVKKMLAEFGATYPVVIDVPSDEVNGLGLLHDWFETYWWPFAVIVDQRGVVAGYGQLWHGIKIDRKGIYYGGNDPWMPSVDPQIKKLTANDGTAKAQEAKERRPAAAPERTDRTARAVSDQSPSPLTASKEAAAEKKRDDDAKTAESRISTHPVTITGVARNINGEPIAKATIYLLSTLYNHSSRVAETTTDTLGQYAFRDAPLPVVRPERNAGGDVHGAFEILGVADGYGFSWRPKKSFIVAPRPAPGEENYISQPHVDSRRRFWLDDPVELDLEFLAASQVKGRIVDDQGRPIAGVKLEMRLCERLHDEIETGVLASAKIYDFTALNQPEDVPSAVKIRKTDAEGRFEFAGLPPECLFRFDLRHPDYARQDVWAATTSNALPKLGGRWPILTGELELVFQTVRDAKVRVVDADSGEPAAGVLVGAASVGHSAGQTSNENGEVTLRVPQGEYAVELLPATGTPYLITKPDEKLTVTAEPADNPSVFKLRRACVLAVTIVDADTGLPIPDVDLWIDARENPDDARTAVKCNDFYFRSWEPPLARVERPVSDKDGKLRALVEPGLRRLGASFAKAAPWYAPDRQGQLLDCQAGQTLNVKFRLRKIAPPPKVSATAEPSPKAAPGQPATASAP